MVQDDWGDGLNEWIENAYVYIDGQNVFDIGGPAYNAALMKWRMYESNGKTVRPTAKYLSAHRDNQPLSVVVRLRG
ncbi:hypothetical protein AGMMS50239_02120 [Bacteroidia bacterium]|nr:hypothetical protein AGMMS50239_02120 [Bacteroidia bacterium]